jgi:hypothetical protein
MMDLDELKKRFVDQVKLRAYDDRYIDKQEEKDILKEAVGNGLSLDIARSALVQVCDKEDYVMESMLDQKVREMLEQFAGNDGHVDKKEFDDAVAILYKASKGRLGEPLCRKKAKDIILSSGWNVREGFMKGGHWFTQI